MGYYENIVACKTEKELLELWKTKEPVTKNYIERKQQKTVSINHKNVFISDGIVNEEVWNSQNGKKILYVLREAYGERGDWDLAEWLLRVKPASSIWKRVIEWNSQKPAKKYLFPDISLLVFFFFNHLNLNL